MPLLWGGDVSKHHKHLLDIYGVHLHAATNKREWRAMRRALPALESEGPEKPTSAGTTWIITRRPKPGGLPIPHVAFWVDRKNHADVGELIDTCAHEASHGANRILEHIGTDVSGGNEPHAYLVGWLTRWLWDACNTS